MIDAPKSFKFIRFNYKFGLYLVKRVWLWFYCFGSGGTSKRPPHPGSLHTFTSYKSTHLSSHCSSHITTKPVFKHLNLGRCRLVHALKLEQTAIFVPFVVTWSLREKCHTDLHAGSTPKITKWWILVNMGPFCTVLVSHTIPHHVH